MAFYNSNSNSSSQQQPITTTKVASTCPGPLLRKRALSTQCDLRFIAHRQSIFRTSLRTPLASHLQYILTGWRYIENIINSPHPPDRWLWLRYSCSSRINPPISSGIFPEKAQQEAIIIAWWMNGSGEGCYFQKEQKTPIKLKKRNVQPRNSHDTPFGFPWPFLHFFRLNNWHESCINISEGPKRKVLFFANLLAF